MTSAPETRTALEVWVAGLPAPQGSKKAIPRYAGRGADRVFTGYISQVEMSKGVKPWREDIRAEILKVTGGPGSWSPLEGSITVQLEFVLKRPASTPKKRTPAAVKRPDLDKLARGVLDAVGSAGLWVDDSQVTTLNTHKRLAELGEAPGCFITITED